LLKFLKLHRLLAIVIAIEFVVAFGVGVYGYNQWQSTHLSGSGTITVSESAQGTTITTTDFNYQIKSLSNTVTTSLKFDNVSVKPGFNFATWASINLVNNGSEPIHGIRISNVKCPPEILTPNFCPVEGNGQSIDPPLDDMGMPTTSLNNSYEMAELDAGKSCKIRFVFAGKAPSEVTSINLNKLSFDFSPY